MTENRWDAVFQGVVKQHDGARSPLMEVTDETLVRSVWHRQGVTLRDRRLLTLGILATNPDPTKMAIHLRAALRAGELTVTELRELAVQVAFYAGWPFGVGMDRLIDSVLDAENVTADGE